MILRRGVQGLCRSALTSWRRPFATTPTTSSVVTTDTRAALGGSAGNAPLVGEPEFVPKESWSSLRRKDGVPLLAEVNWRELDIKGSPKKLNLIARLIRRMPVTEALDQLRFSTKLRSGVFMQVLHKAVEKAEILRGLKKEQLFIALAEVGKGTYEKRLNIQGRGKAGIIHIKKTHLNLTLRQIPESNDPEFLWKYGPRNNSSKAKLLNHRRRLKNEERSKRPPTIEEQLDRIRRVGTRRRPDTKGPPPKDPNFDPSQQQISLQ